MALVDFFETPVTTPFAGLGRGRDLVTEELRDFCIGSTTVLQDYSNAKATYFTEVAMSKQQIVDKFDLNVNLAATLDKVPVFNEDFTFNRSATETDWSIVIVQGADYVLGGRTMDPMTRKLLVDPATTPNWFARCGDHFVMQADVGGQLYVVIRIEFNSLDTKTSFKNALGGTIDWFTAKSTIETHHDTYTGKAVIHVQAVQRGGNVAALGGVLGASGAVDCGVGDMSKCSDLVTKVLAYAGTSDFATGMYQKPQDIKYHWSSWRTVVSAGVPPDRIVPPALLAPRQLLAEFVPEQLALWDRIVRIEAGISGQAGSALLVTSKKFRADLPGLKAAVAHNLDLLRSASTRCYGDLDDPTNAALIDACVTEANRASLASRGYRSDVTLSMIEPTNGLVIGRIEAVTRENGASYLLGWACVRGDAASIDVRLTSGTTLLATGRADLASDPSIAQACNASGAAYRFKFPVDGLIATWSGAPLTVTGYSPYGDDPAPLKGSDQFRVPSGWRSSPGFDSHASGQHIFNRFSDQHSYGTFDEDNSSTFRFADVNGDGRDDACIRNDSGMQCYLSTGSGWQYSREYDSFAMGQFIFANGTDQRGQGTWDADNVKSIAFPDLNGDGKADLCARHDFGLQCWLSTGAGWVKPASYDTWLSNQRIFQRYSDQHDYGTFDGDNDVSVRFPDLNGDGMDDACVRQDYGLQCWLSTGTGFAAAPGYDSFTSGQRIFNRFTDQHGYGNFDFDNWSTVAFPDVNGDGRADACMRHDWGVQCWVSTGVGWNYASGYDSWASGQHVFGNTWDQHGYGNFDNDNSSTIRYPDLNGDGKADICMRSDAGLQCLLSTGTGWEAPAGFDTYATGQNLFFRYWNQQGFGTFDGDNATFIWFPDLDRDGRAEACLRNDFGLQCFRSTGAGFEPWHEFDTFFTKQYIFQNGTSQFGYGNFDWDNLTSIAFPDVDGDGRPDACIRNDWGVQCYTQ